MLRLSVMLLAVAVGALAAAWLQERSDARARRRRVARAVATDAALWAAEEEASGSAEPHTPVGNDELSSQRATGRAVADARVEAAVKRAAAAEAAAAEAEQAAASYRDAYLQAVAAQQSREEQQPADAVAADAAAHRDHHVETSGGVSPSASGTDSDAEWDRVSLAAPQRCAWCGGDAHERCALVPCGHTACAACAHHAASCHTCGEAVQYALQLRE